MIVVEDSKTYELRRWEEHLKQQDDALAEIIRQCHTGSPRVEVHCWLVSHFIWAWKRPPPQPGHVFNSHPEYLTKDSIGQMLVNSGYFLDPGNPDANQWVHDVARDVVTRYDIDGLHWDYCRYPDRDSGYNDASLRRYYQEFGLTGQPAPNDPRFCEWRRRQVTDFLRWTDADLLAIKPGLVISVAVFANLADAYGYRFSDWPAWTQEGIVDAIMPMDFSPNTDQVFRPRADEALKHRRIREVFLGQGAYMNPKETSLAQLKYALEQGARGTVLYSYRTPGAVDAAQASVFGLLREQLQPAWVETPTLAWKQTRGIIKGTVTRGPDKTPCYNATVTINTTPPRSQQTEPHGGFAFFDLPPRQYRVTAEAGAGQATVSPVAVAGQVVTADFALQP